MLKKVLQNYYFLLILSILYIIVFNLASYNYFIQDFLVLEKTKNQQVISEVVKKIDTNLKIVSALNTDYSKWDDTYEFMQYKDPKFLYENFRDEANTLEDLKLDFVLITDLDNKLVYIKYAHNIERKIYPEILKNLQKPNIIQIKELNSKYYYIAKSPILRSDLKGTPKGYFYFGKEINVKELNNNFLSIKILKNSVEAKTEHFKSEFIDKISLESLYNDHELKNIIIFQDENKHRLFTLEIVTKRDIYNKGKDNIIFFNSVISIFFLLLFFIFYWNISNQAKLNAKLQSRVEEEISKQREQEQLLIQQSKLAAMGEMIGNIAHQWRQPLNALGLVLQNIQFTYLMGELDDKFMEKSVKKANLLTSNMSKTIDDFRNFFKPNKHKEIFELNPFIDKTLFLIESTLEHHKIEIIKNYTKENLLIYSYPNEFSQVVLNLLTNAKDALISNNIENPTIEIKTYRKDNNIYLSITDNAHGINEEILEKIFEPYFTTKDEGKGTGIGLYMSKTIVENNMKGILSVETNKNGSTFLIKIPELQESDED